MVARNMPSFCTDENGNNLVFDTREEAEAEAAECQNRLVIEI